MCQSQAEGGRRCAAHTRAAFEALSQNSPGWDDAAAAYASTTEGHARITRESDEAAMAGDHVRAGRLWSALARGEAMREAQREITTQTRAASAAHTATTTRPSVYAMNDRDLAAELNTLVPRNNTTAEPDRSMTPAARDYRARQIIVEIADRMRKGKWDHRVVTGVDRSEGTFENNVAQFRGIGDVGTVFTQHGVNYEVYAFGRVPATKSYGNELANKIDVHVRRMVGPRHAMSRTTFRWTATDYNRAVKAHRAAQAQQDATARGTSFEETLTTLLNTVT